MATSNKVKALLNLKEKTQAGLAAHLKIAPQSLRNKFNRNCFSADDLIKIADYCDVELSYKVDTEHKIVLDIGDVRDTGDDSG